MILQQGILRTHPIVVNKGRHLLPQSKPYQGITLSSIDRLLQTQQPRICILRSLGGIGDVLMSTPTLRALKDKYPHCYLTYATDNNYLDGALFDVLRHNPHIDELIPHQIIGSKDFDFISDITSCCISTESQAIPQASKNGNHVPNRIDIFALHVGVELINPLPILILTSEENDWARKKIQHWAGIFGSVLKIGIQLRSAAVSRTWPLNKVKELVSLLLQTYRNNIHIFMFDYQGLPNDQTWNIHNVTHVRQYNIREVSALINSMDLMVTPDSSLLHIAGALGKKTVSIWAGTDPNSRILYYPNTVAVYKKDYQCHPCWYKPQSCQSTYACINSIQASEVLESIRKLLDSAPLEPGLLKEPTQVTLAQDKNPRECIDSKTININPIPLYKPCNYNIFQRPTHICISRASGGIGDVLMSTPLIRSLKTKHPDCHITYATDPKWLNGALFDILENNPYIDEVIPYQMVQDKHFDFISDISTCCVDTENLDKYYVELFKSTTIPNRIDIFADHVGVKLTHHTPVLVLTTDELSWANDFILKNKTRPQDKTLQSSQSSSATSKNLIKIGIQVNSAMESRNWPLEKVKELCTLLGQTYKDTVKIFLFDHDNQIPVKIPNAIQVKDLSIRDTSALINCMDLMITPDSALLHIAGALGVKTVSIWAGVDSNARINYYPNTIAVHTNLPCYPCWYNDNVCKKTYTCIKSIQTAEVLEAVKQLLKQPLIKLPSNDCNSNSFMDYKIIRWGGMGDLINCLPAFRGLRKKNPSKKINLTCGKEFIPVMQLTNCFDQLTPLLDIKATFESDKNLYDARGLFENNKNSAKKGCYFETKPRSTVMADFLDVEEKEMVWDFSIEKDLNSIRRCKEILWGNKIDLNVQKICTFQPLATNPTRSWHKEYFKPLLQQLIKLGYVPVSLHDKPDLCFDLKGTLNLSGKLSMLEFNSMIGLSSVFIGTDSGGLHLAHANNVPFVCIFNCIPPKLRLGKYDNYEVIYPKLKCTPCWDMKCDKMTCMKQITPELVIQYLKKLLESKETNG